MPPKRTTSVPNRAWRISLDERPLRARAETRVRRARESERGKRRDAPLAGEAQDEDGKVDGGAHGRAEDERACVERESEKEDEKGGGGRGTQRMPPRRA